MRTSMLPWPVTSAAAGPISGSVRRSELRQKERDMPAILQNISRRGFLIGGAAAAGGLVVGLRLFPHGLASSSVPAAPAIDVPRFNPTAFVAIDQTGLVTIVVHRSEMGQGVRTALPMAVADELHRSEMGQGVRTALPMAVADE